MKDNLFNMEFEVRDNEVDMQGVVNNANYYIYLAHARHKFLKEIGISFSKMSEEKQYLLLTASNIEFKRPLRAEDKFYVTCKLVPEGEVRFAFEQDIKKSSDDTLIVKSYNIGACIDGNNRNRPYIPEIIKKYFPATNEEPSI
jgi:acyl-CoA thioester hydrolase